MTAELTRLHPTNIVILGGTGVVSSGVATSLGTYGAVTRLAGADRYETAVAISGALNPTPGAGIDTAYIATGANFPDALGGGPLAASLDGPILLVPGTSIPAAVDG